MQPTETSIADAAFSRSPVPGPGSRLLLPAESRVPRPESRRSEQNHIELLLPILLLGLETDRLADEGFQLGDRRRFFLQHPPHHRRRREHQQFPRIELAHRTGDLAEDLVADRLGGLEDAPPAASRAWLAQLPRQALGRALRSEEHTSELQS